MQNQKWNRIGCEMKILTQYEKSTISEWKLQDFLKIPNKYSKYYDPNIFPTFGWEKKLRRKMKYWNIVLKEGTETCKFNSNEFWPNLTIYIGFQLESILNNP